MNIFAEPPVAPTMVYPSMGNGRRDELLVAEERDIILSAPTANHPMGATGIGAPLTSHKALVTPEGELITFVSDKYEVLQNTEIQNGIEQILDQDPDLVLHSRENNGFKTTWTLALNEPLGEIKVGGTIREFTYLIRMSNSLDATKAFSIDQGTMIYFCKNQFARPARGTDFYRRHMGEPIDLAGIMNRVYERKADTIESFEKLALTIDDWDNDRINKAFAELTQAFPNTASGGPNPHSNRILETFRRDAKIYGHGGLALWMAATEVTTYWRDYNIPASYVAPLQKQLWKVFG